MKTQKNINNPGGKEREILNAAKPAFEEATGFCITILEVEPAEKIYPDAVLQIDVPDVEPKGHYDATREEWWEKTSFFSEVSRQQPV